MRSRIKLRSIILGFLLEITQKFNDCLNNWINFPVRCMPRQLKLGEKIIGQIKAMYDIQEIKHNALRMI